MANKLGICKKQSRSVRQANLLILAMESGVCRLASSHDPEKKGKIGALMKNFGIPIITVIPSIWGIPVSSYVYTMRLWVIL